MNLSDSKKKLALAGVVCGIVAACLAALGNPANMAGILEETAGDIDELKDANRSYQTCASGRSSAHLQTARPDS